MKTVSKTLLVLYLLGLLWLVLFKFSFDFVSVLFDYQIRSLNLIPFVDTSRSEMISNFAVFIPFGLLLCVNFKRVNLWRKLAIIFTFSLLTEIIQFTLAIGRTDITDLITNTLGGLFGLAIYGMFKKYIDTKYLDYSIVIAGFILLVLFIYLRVFVFKVRY